MLGDMLDYFINSTNSNRRNFQLYTSNFSKLVVKKVRKYLLITDF